MRVVEYERADTKNDRQLVGPRVTDLVMYEEKEDLQKSDFVIKDCGKFDEKRSSISDDESV